MLFILEDAVENITKKQILTLRGREELIMDGVDNVLGFDNNGVSLLTTLGKVIIEGNDLKIESLTKSDHTVVIVGVFSGVYFADDKARKKGR